MIFAGKSKNGDGEALLWQGRPVSRERTGFSPGLSHLQRGNLSFPQACLAHELLKEKHSGKPHIT
jgi:hypothetical protein